MQVMAWSQGRVSLKDVLLCSKPAEENRLEISNGAEKSNSRKVPDSMEWADPAHGWMDSALAALLVPRGRERSVDEEVGGFLWCAVGGRKQPYRWLLSALKSARKSCWQKGKEVSGGRHLS